MPWEKTDCLAPGRRRTALPRGEDGPPCPVDGPGRRLLQWERARGDLREPSTNKVSGSVRRAPSVGVGPRAGRGVATGDRV